jgi:predicted KAP-like P-loop ATPase
MRNFTNVVYLLVFDKEVVLKTIADTKELSGEAYLEKIIQVSFELSIPDKISLRRLLFKKLGNIFIETLKHQISQPQWYYIYFQGIDHFITKIRDVARFINILTNSILSFGDEVIIIRFILRLLHQFDEISRFELLKKAITQGKALAMINHKFNLEEQGLVNAQHLKELEEIAARIEVKSNTKDKIY